MLSSGWAQISSQDSSPVAKTAHRSMENSTKDATRYFLPDFMRQVDVVKENYHFNYRHFFKKKQKKRVCQFFNNTQLLVFLLTYKL
jgi:hypothetical protein